MEKSDEEATGGAAVSGPSGAGRTQDGEEEGSKFRPTGEYRRHDIQHNDTQIKPFGMTSFFAILSINGTQHNGTQC